MHIIKTIAEQEQVEEFMRVMGQEMPTILSIPSPKVQHLRWNLIHEENKELMDAAIAGDLVEVADALCDLLYVVLGAFSAYGINPTLAKELFDEVQRSNMSKTCANEEEAQATIDKLVSQDISNPDGSYKEYVMIQVGDRWVVNRVSDNKTQKSINFSEPKLKPILRKHGVNI